MAKWIRLCKRSSLEKSWDEKRVNSGEPSINESVEGNPELNGGRDDLLNVQRLRARHLKRNAMVMI